MNREDLMLSETSHSQRINSAWFRLHEVPRIARFIETESRMVVSKAVEREE